MNTSNDEQLDERTLKEISKFLDMENWIKVGRQLRVPHAELTRIDMDINNDYHDCAYKMLMAWWHQKPKATLEELYAALKELKLEFAIREIKNHFTQKKTLHNSATTDDSTQMPALSHTNEQDDMFSGCGTTSAMGLNEDMKGVVKEKLEKQGMPSTDEFQAAIMHIPVNENIIWDITKFLKNPKWIELGHQLQIQHSQIDLIASNYRHNHRECAYRMLITWQKLYEKCIVQDLFEVLRKSEWVPIEEIQEYLRKQFQLS